jgi:hypothetical protein
VEGVTREVLLEAVFESLGIVEKCLVEEEEREDGDEINR